jgi:hypothetical protein
MSPRLAAGVLAILAFEAVPAAAQAVTSVPVIFTYGTITLPPGSNPATASYVAASAILPAEVLNDLAAAHSPIAPLLVALRDGGGPNTILSNLFTSASHPEAGFDTLVAKAASVVTDVRDPAQILRQAIVLGLPGTGTGQTVASTSPSAATHESFTYHNLPVVSGPPCPGCTFDGRVDITLTRVDFTVANPAAGVTVPIVLSSAGLNGSFFTSELTLTNRGTTDASITYAFTSAFGGSSGTAPDTLAAGRQKVVPDTIEFLKGLGVPVGASGNRGGTLKITFTNLSSPDAGAATVRTTSAVAGGRAGLSYPGLLSSRLLSSPVVIAGLRQTDTDRSNVAVLNAGGPADGNITLRVTVFSGEKLNNVSQALPDVVLSPGGFSQISGILTSNGLAFTNGYVEVQRIVGTAPFYAYGVINDQATSDGSFVAPVPVAPQAALSSLTLPVLVETSSFSTELVLTNFSNVLRGVRLTYFSSALTGGSASLLIKLEGGEQQILPNFVQILRDRGAVSNAAGPVFAGPLVAVDTTGDLRGIAVGARTSIPGDGGRFGLFSEAVPSGSEATERAWIYGLQQNADNRTNLAIVNTGSSSAAADTFRIDLFDGATGQKVPPVDNLSVPAGGFIQLNAILTTFAPGLQNAYALVTRTSGSNPFLCYAVVNDGGTAGQRTGDGAFLQADVPGAQ